MRAVALVTAAVTTALLAMVVLVVPATPQTETGLAVALTTFALAFLLLGALVAVRRSENSVGWLMLVVGVLMSVPVVTSQYAGYVLFGTGGDPATSTPTGLSTPVTGASCSSPGATACPAVSRTRPARVPATTMPQRRSSGRPSGMSRNSSGGTP